MECFFACCVLTARSHYTCCFSFVYTSSVHTNNARYINTIEDSLLIKSIEQEQETWAYLSHCAKLYATIIITTTTVPKKLGYRYLCVCVCVKRYGKAQHFESNEPTQYIHYWISMVQTVFYIPLSQFSSIACQCIIMMFYSKTVLWAPFFDRRSSSKFRTPSHTPLTMHCTMHIEL